MSLSDELSNLLKSQGASLVGFANLSELDPATRDGYPYGISIAIALNPHIIAQVKGGPTKLYVEECFRVDDILSSLGKMTVELLTLKGHKAKQQDTTNIAGTDYPPNLTTKLPHKTVATRAGLGWIGKCALFVTREFGSAVRLGSVLTDARLPFGIPIDISHCGDCVECVNACPTQTITLEEWHAGIERDALVDVSLCLKTARKLLSKRIGREITGRTFCGICIFACPRTQGYIKNAG